MHHVPVAMHASVSTPTMVVRASHASQEQSQTQPPLQTTALVALFEEMLSSRQWELRARNAHREDSQTKLEVPASTVQQVSTAMGVGVSRALLDRSPRKIGAAAICVWHSARATTVPMVSFVKFAQTARSLRTIARAVPHVPLDMLVSTACASHAHLHNNHASTRFHVIQSVTGVSHAQTRRCSTLRTDGCQQLVRFVSPV